MVEGVQQGPVLVGTFFTAAYSTRLREEVCTTEEWEYEGRIHASAKRQHLNPSNDGLEFF